jgi:hypothetical protein
MKIEVEHEMLVAGENALACRQQVERFFGRTTLVHYTAVKVDVDRIVSALDEGFRGRVTSGLATNRATLEQLLSELRSAGFSGFDDLILVPQGLPSKIIHTIAHLVDGFFGIDSHFYNLIDDSHSVSDARWNEIGNVPERHWMVPVTGALEAGIDQTVALRMFEKD